MAAAAIVLHFGNGRTILQEKAQDTAAKLSEVRRALHQQGISSCQSNSLYTVIKHSGVAVTGKHAQELPAVCLGLAGALRSLAFMSNTLFQPSSTHALK